MAAELTQAKQMANITSLVSDAWGYEELNYKAGARTNQYPYFLEQSDGSIRMGYVDNNQDFLYEIIFDGTSWGTPTNTGIIASAFFGYSRQLNGTIRIFYENNATIYTRQLNGNSWDYNTVLASGVALPNKKCVSVYCEPTQDTVTVAFYKYTTNANIYVSQNTGSGTTWNTVTAITNAEISSNASVSCINVYKEGAVLFLAFVAYSGTYVVRKCYQASPSYWQYIPADIGSIGYTNNKIAGYFASIPASFILYVNTSNTLLIRYGASSFTVATQIYSDHYGWCWVVPGKIIKIFYRKSTEPNLYEVTFNPQKATFSLPKIIYDEDVPADADMIQGFNTIDGTQKLSYRTAVYSHLMTYIRREISGEISVSQNKQIMAPSAWGEIFTEQNKQEVNSIGLVPPYALIHQDLQTFNASGAYHNTGSISFAQNKQETNSFGLNPNYLITSQNKQSINILGTQYNFGEIIAVQSSQKFITNVIGSMTAEQKEQIFSTEISEVTYTNINQNESEMGAKFSILDSSLVLETYGDSVHFEVNILSQWENFTISWSDGTDEYYSFSGGLASITKTGLGPGAHKHYLYTDVFTSSSINEFDFYADSNITKISGLSTFVNLHYLYFVDCASLTSFGSLKNILIYDIYLSGCSSLTSEAMDQYFIEQYERILQIGFGGQVNFTPPPVNATVKSYIARSYLTDDTEHPAFYPESIIYETDYPYHYSDIDMYQEKNYMEAGGFAGNRINAIQSKQEISISSNVVNYYTGTIDAYQNQQSIFGMEKTKGEISLTQNKQTANILGKYHNTGEISLTQNKQIANILGKYHNTGEISLTQSKQTINLLGGHHNTGAITLVQNKQSVSIVSVDNPHGNLLLSQNKQTMFVIGAFKYDGEISLTQSKQTANIISKYHNIGEISLAQSKQKMEVHNIGNISIAQHKQTVFISGRAMTLWGHVNVLQKRERINIVSYITNNYGASSISQNKQTINTRAHIVSNSGSISSEQAKQAIEIETMVNYGSHIHVRQNKQSISVSARLHNVIVASLSQKKQTINIHSKLKYSGAIEFTQNKQSLNSQGYIINNYGVIVVAQFKQSMVSSGIQKISGAVNAPQAKQAVAITCKYHYLSSINTSQKEQGINVISYIVNNYGTINSEQQAQSMEAIGIQNNAGSIHISQTKQSCGVSGHVINYFDGSISAQEKKQRARINGTVTIYYDPGDKFILKERQNVKLYAVWSKNP